MQSEYLEGKSGKQQFEKIQAEIYRGNPYFRGTEGSIETMLLHGKSAFQQHAEIKKFLLRDGNDVVGRFALIHDRHLPDYVQVAYFEAIEGLGDIWTTIKKAAKQQFPEIKKAVVGFNGHLNYGVGILLNRFDEVPLFGLPYNPSYYADYFKTLYCHRMYSFRFTMEAYQIWADQYNLQRQVEGLQVRFMDKSQIKKESAIYTLLNNQAFAHHPFWSDRQNEEDLELFYPFRFLLDNENLIIAEVHDRPVGFFLWYPDFNQLVSGARDLNLWDFLRYRTGKRPDTFRFTEIGIIPEFQRSPVAYALISKSLSVLLKQGYQYCEGGFIFEENKASMAFVKRILKRCYGHQPEPYRHFAIFEAEI